jgi:hypothetical protein
MNKHTPGPWTSVCAPEIEPDESTHYISCKHGVLGYWRGQKRHHTDSNWILKEADANLIAAAPELLEALQDLLNDVGRASSMLGAIKARAAIAKATGATP